MGARPSAGGDAALHELAPLVERLVRLLEEETRLLAAGRIDALSRIRADKAALAEDYERLVRSLGRNPLRPGESDPALMDRLQRAAEALDRALAENRRRLEAAREAGRRLMLAVLQAAAERRPTPAVYDAGGAAPQPPPAAPITLDRRL